MKHKVTHILITALIASSLVNASNIEITGIYYDPIQAESGKNSHSPLCA